MALQELVCISPFTLISSTCDASVSHPSFLLSQCIPPEDSVPTKQCQEGWVASLGEAASCSLRLWQLDEWDSHQGLWHAVHFRDLVSYLHKKWGSQRKYFRNADLLSYLNSHLSLSLFFLFLCWVFLAVCSGWRLSWPTTCGILVSRPGIEYMPPALGSRFLTTGPPGMSRQLPSWSCFICASVTFSRTLSSHILLIH